jgi:hypothetical protein
VHTILPFAKVHTILPFDKVHTILPFAKVQTILPFDKVHTILLKFFRMACCVIDNDREIIHEYAYKKCVQQPPPTLADRKLHYDKASHL